MGITPHREIIQIEKNMDQLLFEEECIYEISKPYLKFIMDGRMDGQTDKPKAICPFNFFQNGGLKIHWYTKSCAAQRILCKNTEVRPF